MKTKRGRWRKLPRTGRWHFVEPGARKSLCGRLLDEELIGGALTLIIVVKNEGAETCTTDTLPACSVCDRARSAALR